MTESEARARMEEHGQICVRCGGVDLDPKTARCRTCGADDWLEPEDFQDKRLPTGWAKQRLRELQRNVP